MTPNEFFSRLCVLDRKAQALIAEAGLDCKDGPGCKVCPDPGSPEDRFFLEALSNLMAPLEDLHEALEYLKAPTHGEYQLERFPNGRYGYFDDHGIRHIFTCGSSIEAKITDAHGRPQWIRTRMEHDGNDYFLWLHGSVPLAGLTIRERR